MVFLTTLSLPHPVQMTFASVILVAMALMLGVANRWRGKDLVLDHLRTLVLVLGLVLTLRYISWRIAYTVNFHDLASYAGALALLAAEIYGIVMYFLGAVVNAKPLHRPLRPLHEASAPTVDVLIPTYNEEDAILEVTILAATQMDYPADRFRVYLLDDGGTLAKRRQADLDASADAWNRQMRLRALCERAGQDLEKTRALARRFALARAPLALGGFDPWAAMGATRRPTIAIALSAMRRAGS